MGGSISWKAAALLVLGLGLGISPAARGADEATGNRLASESSPYLLMHADNPVDWYPWGEAAFQKAREENKLIFLSIGYSTCYWCHVMEREVFEDPESAARLNAHFVSVLVDREERPDLDRIFMRARILTSGDGGWPLSLFLTPDLDPVMAAGTILNPQFDNLLSELQTGWATDEARYRQHAARIAAAVAQSGRLPGEGASQGLPGRELVARAVDDFARSYDARHGGFGTRAKFPQASILEMLMAAAERGGPDAARAMAVDTLSAMARGGIYDHLGGGFHRYTVDPAWQVPHFEKMLYDNAQLLRAYARGYALTGDDDLRRAAEGIVAYLAREMTAPSGLFYSAQDSENEGEEGAFYLWKWAELEALLPEPDFAFIANHFELVPVPGGEAGQVLNRARPAGPTDARWEAARRKLLEARAARMPLFRDDKVIASWNGLTIEALAYAGRRLDRPDYLRLAERAARALLPTLADGEGGLLRIARGGEAKIPAQLSDYAAVILGLTELYRATGNAFWRGEAARLADRMIAVLYDETNGGFFDAPPEAGELAGPFKVTDDGALPAGNSLAARALIGLATEGLDRFAFDARNLLGAFAPSLEARPSALPYMLWALLELNDRPAQAQSVPARGSAEVVRLAARLLDGDQSGDQSGDRSGDRNGEAPLRLRVALEIDEGWHVNANPASFDFLVPTTISARIGASGPPLAPAYPSGTSLDTPLGSWEVYGNAMSFEIDLPSAPPSGRAHPSIAVRAELQACNDSGTCLPPEILDLALYM